jgi:hypothetical protein
MADIIFADGLMAKRPHENAPPFIICKLSIKVDDFAKTVKKHAEKGWLNIVVKESKNGIYYAVIDDWKPRTKDVDQEEPEDDSLPF